MYQMFHLTLQGYKNTPEQRRKRDEMRFHFASFRRMYCIPETDGPGLRNERLNRRIEADYYQLVQDRFMIQDYDRETDGKWAYLISDLIKFSKTEPKYPILLINCARYRYNNNPDEADIITYNIQADSCIAEIWTSGRVPPELEEN